MRRLIAALATVLTVAGCEDPSGPDGGLWAYSEGTDYLTGRPWADAALRHAESGMVLYVACSEGAFYVYVFTDFITDSGAVRYRLDEGSQRTGDWTESTDSQALFYPGSSRTFARELAGSDVMIFEAREQAAGSKAATFQLGGLAAHLPGIERACA